MMVMWPFQHVDVRTGVFNMNVKQQTQPQVIRMYYVDV